ncbi:hypothetical protein [Bradyrhizobium sp. CCBAU 051011]|uniref:hypothetical protein n=1 Tax=Bradyrhizobium sp. CCBAU 051011 TaxID=858422 RepID=UPI001379ADE6|nr:hypothetical protein [Bradyrhizobium sp. CCBAU 051011]
MVKKKGRRTAPEEEMATALDRWDEESGAQELAWPLPYEASDLRDVERRVLECLGAALVSEWNDLPTDVQRRLFEHAASGKSHDATALTRFLHDHKGASRVR